MQNQNPRFTDQARQITHLSHVEAERLKHSWVGTEHLLVALIQEPEGIAGQVLRASGLDAQQVQVAVEKVMPTGKHVLERIDLTPDLRKALQLAVDEARQLGHHEIGTEHLLLALLRQKRTPGSRVIEKLKINREEMRHQVLAIIQTNSPVPSSAEASVNQAISESKATEAQSTASTPSPSSSPVSAGIYIWVKMRDTEAHTRYYDAHPTRSSRLRALFGLRSTAQSDERDQLPPS
ncbi:MAG TPA: Clp protease N-terminal domain-containing protein [Phototrophicaceae bacterium]|jgi:ATP-dependent Clp protease ATP-binding subunit ClpA|nr:Clp protease N-terminal domain-containing protein [Phototrophicaceae bacterium]